MRRILATVALLSALAIPIVTHADTVTNFNISGILQGGSLSGTLPIDITTGRFQTPNFTVSLNGTGYLFNSLYGQGMTLQNTFGVFMDAGGDFFQIALDLTSLMGYGGSSLCALSTPCSFPPGDTAGLPSLFQFGPRGPLVFVQSGALTVTPEPSAFLLVGSGLIGIAGAVRRKKPSEC